MDARKALCERVQDIQRELPGQLEVLLDVRSSLEEGNTEEFFDALLVVYTSHVEILTLLRLYNIIESDEGMETLQTKYEESLAGYQKMFMGLAGDLQRFIEYATELQQQLNTMEYD